MRTPFSLLPLAAFATLLTGCEKAPAPTTAVQLQVARPVFTLVAGATGRVAIPRTALTVRGGTPVVLVLNERDEARERMVRTGRHYNGQVEILAGLRGDERLVLGELAGVRDGSPILITKNTK